MSEKTPKIQVKKDKEEKWKSFLESIINLPIKEEYLDRGKDIKQILTGLSKYQFDTVFQFRNIRDVNDFARNELIGSAQRYIYGNFLDSIFCSCNSVEVGLLIKLDAKLTNSQKEKVTRPPKLGKIIGWSYEHSILDKTKPDVVSAIDEIHEIRNIHAHPINFVSGLIISYKPYVDQFDDSTLRNLKTKFNEISTRFRSKDKPSRSFQFEDVIKAIQVMKLLPTFEWCSNKEYIVPLKGEVDKLIKDVSSLITLAGIGTDISTEDFQMIILKKRAFTAISNAHLILQHIGIL
ncbi:MAG: hypothetical protein ACFFCW_34720 [Candidatus Hodarchaeota archaeon]